jgi:DNA-binding MarR family transcriptional regulator
MERIAEREETIMHTPPRPVVSRGGRTRGRSGSRAARRAAEDSPGFLLWRATLRWQRAVAAALAPLDLTPVQFILLSGLRRLEGFGPRPNQVELAGYAGIDAKTVSQALRTLERKRLLTREVDRTDVRARLLSTTPAGADLSVAAVRVVEAADAVFFRAVGSREQVIPLLRGLGGAGR